MAEGAWALGQAGLGLSLTVSSRSLGLRSQLPHLRMGDKHTACRAHVRLRPHVKHVTGPSAWMPSPAPTQLAWLGRCRPAQFRLQSNGPLLAPGCGAKRF